MTIARITGGSFTTDSLAPIGLCLATSASSTGSVTVSPWNQISPVSSSTNTAGHWLSGVSGVIPTKLSRITASSIGGVPKWVFLADGNPDAEAWLVHAVDRQDKQSALSLCRQQRAMAWFSSPSRSALSPACLASLDVRRIVSTRCATDPGFVSPAAGAGTDRVGASGFRYAACRLARPV